MRENLSSYEVIGRTDAYTYVIEFPTDVQAAVENKSCAKEYNELAKGTSQLKFSLAESYINKKMGISMPLPKELAAVAKVKYNKAYKDTDLNTTGKCVSFTATKDNVTANLFSRSFY